MKKETGDFEKAVLKRMVDAGIENYLELSKITGLGYQTMRTKLRKPQELRLYELKALDEVLKFDDSEKLNLLRG